MITNDMTKQEQAEHECRPSAEQQQNRAAALWAGRGSKIAPGHGGCRKVLLQVILTVKGHRLHFLFKAHKNIQHTFWKQKRKSDDDSVDFQMARDRKS